jgi:hypothetical protein
MSDHDYRSQRPRRPRSPASQDARPRVDGTLGNAGMLEWMASCEDDGQDLLPSLAPHRPEEVELLRDHALALREEGVDGVELWAQLMEEALDLARDDEETAEGLLDRAVQDVAAVTVGRYHIQSEVDGAGGPLHMTLGRAGRQTLAELEELYHHLPEHPTERYERYDPYFAGTGLDPTDGRSFRPDISDGTNNQIFHTGFFQYLAYAVDGTTLADAGNLAHETTEGAPAPSNLRSQMLAPGRPYGGLADVVRILPDGGINWAGQTREDLQASLDGADLGMVLRDIRDSPSADYLVEAVPDLIRAAYGREAPEPGSPAELLHNRFAARRSPSPFNFPPARLYARARERLDAHQGPAAVDARGEGDGDLDLARVIIDHYEADVARGDTDNLTARLEQTLAESGLGETMQAAVRRRVARAAEASAAP